MLSKCADEMCRLSPLLVWQCMTPSPNAHIPKPRWPPKAKHDFLSYLQQEIAGHIEKQQISMASLASHRQIAINYGDITIASLQIHDIVKLTEMKALSPTPYPNMCLRSRARGLGRSNFRTCCCQCCKFKSKVCCVGDLWLCRRVNWIGHRLIFWTDWSTDKDCLVPTDP